MAIRNSRGIDNILLRRVRRHQTMSALFRKVHRDSAQPAPVWSPSLVQTKPEDFPLAAPTQTPAGYTPSTPSKPESMIQRTTSSSPVKPQNPKQQAAESETVSSPAPAPISDPVWKRLEMIFRKHEEQEEGSPASASEPVATTPSHSNQERETVQEHPNEKNTISTESSLEIPDHVQAPLPETRVQRVTQENATPANSQPTESTEITQPHSLFGSSLNDAVNDNRMVNDQSVPDQTIQQTDPTVVHTNSIRQQPPLEDVWNVQRLDDHEPHSAENPSTSFLRSTYEEPDGDQSRPSFRVYSAPEPQTEQKAQPLGEPEDHQPGVQADLDNSQRLSEVERVSLAPIETLSPSKPRPAPIASVESKGNVQRQTKPEVSSAKKMSEELSEQSPVDTSIGPLPADLWWLLGEKPPSGETKSAVPNERTTSVSHKEGFQEQSTISHEQTSPANLVPGTSTPNTIQRQALLNPPPVSNIPEPVHAEHADKPKQAETDLDELARRVYAEVRRRLAAEWERTR